MVRGNHYLILLSFSNFMWKCRNKPKLQVVAKQMQGSVELALIFVIVVSTSEQNQAVKFAAIFVRQTLLNLPRLEMFADLRVGPLRSRELKSCSPLMYRCRTWNRKIRIHRWKTDAYGDNGQRPHLMWSYTGWVEVGVTCGGVYGVLLKVFWDIFCGRLRQQPIDALPIIKKEGIGVFFNQKNYIFFIGELQRWWSMFAPLWQKIKGSFALSPTLHHPHCVKGSQKPSSTSCPHGPERLETDEMKRKHGMFTGHTKQNTVQSSGMLQLRKYLNLK